MEEVVVEGTSRRRNVAIAAGRTRQGKVINFDAGETDLCAGTYVSVKVVSAGAHHLVGELVSVAGSTSPANRTRRPIRVPVHSA